MNSRDIFTRLVQRLLDDHLTLGVAIRGYVAAAIREAFAEGYKQGTDNAKRGLVTK